MRGVHVTEARHGSQPALRVRHGDATVLLVPFWAGEGFPQDVRRALDDAPQVTPPATLILAARRISAGAQALLGERGTSWADETGRAVISAPHLLVVKDAPQPPKATPAPSAFRWTEGSAGIAECVLADAEAARAQPVAVSSAAVVDRLGVSPALVSHTFARFDAQGWTVKSGPERGINAARRLVDAGQMLSAWAAWHSPRTQPVVEAHGLIRDTETWLRDEVTPHWHGHQWALTGAAASDRRAPYLSSIPTIDLYLDARDFVDDGVLDGLLTSVGLRRVDRGARVRVFEADRHVLKLATSLNGVPQVSDIRLYGDLLALGLRGPDAADHLRTTRIGF